MILTGSKIQQEVKKGSIDIHPFNLKQLNPNSYNVKLSNKLYLIEKPVIDLKEPCKYKEIIIPEEGYVLSCNEFYLGSTVELIGSSEFVPMIEGRSSIARCGVAVHITAGFGDLGFFNNFTLEIKAFKHTRIYPYMEIAQVYFLVPDGKIDDLYDGKYNTKYKIGTGIGISKIYEELQNKEV